MSPSSAGLAIIRCVLGAWAVYLPGEVAASYRNTYGAAYDALFFAGWRCVHRGALNGDEDRWAPPASEPVCLDCQEPVDQRLYGLVWRHTRCESHEAAELAPSPDDLPEVLA